MWCQRIHTHGWCTDDTNTAPFSEYLFVWYSIKYYTYGYSLPMKEQERLNFV